MRTKEVLMPIVAAGMLFGAACSGSNGAESPDNSLNDPEANEIFVIEHGDDAAMVRFVDHKIEAGLQDADQLKKWQLCPEELLASAALFNARAEAAENIPAAPQDPTIENPQELSKQAGLRQQAAQFARSEGIACTDPDRNDGDTVDFYRTENSRGESGPTLVISPISVMRPHIGWLSDVEFYESYCSEDGSSYDQTIAQINELEAIPIGATITDLGPTGPIDVTLTERDKFLRLAELNAAANLKEQTEVCT